ncbi:hypothetical protein SEA_MISCHIEF19_9 [Streptomyces phage Mischief19]|nr:hypothetical protein SEA_MISCHIEF19_9 [Streptomyces phage Mischief19]
MQITVNAPGAKTLADARPMMIDGQRVYVTVGAGEAALHIGGRIVATREADDMSTVAAQQWAVEYTEAANYWAEQQHAEANEHRAAAEQWAEVDVTEQPAPAVEITEANREAVQGVRDAGRLLAAEAVKMAAKGAANPGRYRYVNARGKVVFFGPADPRHPINAAKVLAENAARLADWSAADEAAYARYVDDGLSATDGYYAPISRAAWGATLGKR